MRRTLIATLAAAGLAGGYASIAAQTGGSAQPFKLGTFERSGQPLLGLVLRDTDVVDIARANAALEQRDGSLPKVRMPADMKDLIGRYDTDLKDRLHAIAGSAASTASAPLHPCPEGSRRCCRRSSPRLLAQCRRELFRALEGIAQQQQRAGAAPAPPSRAVSAPGLWDRKAATSATIRISS